MFGSADTCTLEFGVSLPLGQDAACLADYKFQRVQVHEIQIKEQIGKVMHDLFVPQGRG